MNTDSFNYIESKYDPKSKTTIILKKNNSWFSKFIEGLQEERRKQKRSSEEVSMFTGILVTFLYQAFWITFVLSGLLPLWAYWIACIPQLMLHFCHGTIYTISILEFETLVIMAVMWIHPYPDFVLDAMHNNSDITNHTIELWELEHEGCVYKSCDTIRYDKNCEDCLTIKNNVKCLKSSD